MTLFGDNDTEALMDAVSCEDVVQCCVYMNERNHMILNSIARTERRLAKVFTILDFTGTRPLTAAV